MTLLKVELVAFGIEHIDEVLAPFLNRSAQTLVMVTGPSKAARLAEVLEFLHRHLMAATDNIACNEDVTQVILGSVDWQRIQIVQMLLARYLRGVAEPDQMEE